MTVEAVLFAVLIFVLRVINYAISTLRMVSITRGQRWLAAILAILEAYIFVVVIAEIVGDLENFINLFAYCAGAAGGSWAGMVLEARLIRGHMIVNIFANVQGREIAMALREAGYGVTEFVGQGRDGEVTTLRSVVDKRDVKKFSKLVNDANPNAFIAMEEARTVRHGWLGIGRGRTV